METKPIIPSPQVDVSKNDQMLANFLKAWDIKENFFSMFKRPKGVYEVLDGLRAICFITVIVGHTYVHYIMARLKNNESQRSLYKDYEHLGMNPGPILFIIFNASFVIDTFFSLSGFLIATMLVKEYQRSNSDRWYLRIDAVRFLLRRWVRLLPALIFAMTVFSLRWHFAKEDAIDYNRAEQCKQWWWTIFMMNNNQNTCLNWTWTIGIEFKFYIISIPLVLITMRHFRLGMVIFGLLSVASVAIMEYINMDISNTVDSAADFWWENYKQIYFPAYTRWNPYLFGMVAGILYLRRAAGSQEAILDEATETKVENNNVLLYASYVVTFVVLFGLPAVENYRWHSTLTLHLYESLARTVYGIAITYVVYMCVIGYMKPLNAFLSHDIFFLISQLTYSGYLLHPLYREVIEVIDFTVLGITPFMFISLGILGIIFVMAIALPVYLLIEKPFVNLRPI